MKKITIMILSMIFVLSVAAAFSYAQEGVQRVIYMEEYEPIYSVDIDNTIWDVEIDDGDITGVSEDGMMWFFLGDITGAKDLEDAVDQVNEEIRKDFTNIQILSALESFTINGLSAYAYEATAEANGKDVVMFVVLFHVETGEIGTLLFIMDPLAEKLHFEKIMQMTMSVARR